MKATLTNFGQPPRKVNLLATLVRGKKVDEAITILNFTDKKSAEHIVKLIQSAAANAVTNFNANRADLVIKEITVNKGLVLKRSMPRARGSAFIIRRRTSHIAVTLSAPNLEVKQVVKADEAEAKPAKKVVKKVAPKTKKTK